MGMYKIYKIQTDFNSVIDKQEARKARIILNCISNDDSISYYEAALTIVGLNDCYLIAVSNKDNIDNHLKKFEKVKITFRKSQKKPILVKQFYRKFRRYNL